jgi:hypothetical protein
VLRASLRRPTVRRPKAAEVGVACFPAPDQTTAAASGQGGWWNGAPLKCPRVLVAASGGQVHDGASLGRHVSLEEGNASAGLQIARLARSLPMLTYSLPADAPRLGSNRRGTRGPSLPSRSRFSKLGATLRGPQQRDRLWQGRASNQQGASAASAGLDPWKVGENAPATGAIEATLSCCFVEWAVVSEVSYLPRRGLAAGAEPEQVPQRVQEKRLPRRTQ